MNWLFPIMHLGFVVSSLIMGAFVLAAVGTAYSAYTAYQGMQMQKDAAKAYEARLQAAQVQAEENTKQFQADIEALDKAFDPYDTTEAFASLYEAVILPLNRDFDENIMPELEATFGGGAFGADYQSGARRAGIKDAAMDKAETIAGLHYKERGEFIDRSFTDFNRRLGILDKVYESNVDVVNARLGMAGGIYGAQGDTASARVAAGSAIGSALTGLGGGMIQGSSALSGSGGYLDQVYTGGPTKEPHATSGIK